MPEWKQIGFTEFVERQQKLVINKTGLLEKDGYWIEWGEIMKFGIASIHSLIRLEERPMVRAPMDEMSMYFKKGDN